MTYPRLSSGTTELLTFQDAYQRLVIAAGSRDTGTESNAYRAAIVDAMRSLPGKHDWSYYKRVLQITTSEPDSTLEGSYDHTGGTYERQLTLSTGTWSDIAEHGQVLMNNNLFDIERRISDTVVTLTADSNPGQDAATTGITWCRTAYDLGQRVRRIHYVSEAVNDVPLSHVSQAELAMHLRRTPQVSTPIIYNIHQSGGAMSSIEIEFAPPPLDARAYVIPFEAQPRPLRTLADLARGTASGTTFNAGGESSFKPWHVGSVLRVIDNSTDTPTSQTGNKSLFTPWIEQRIITSVAADGSSCTIDSAFDDSYSGVNAIVTDPLDLDPAVMWEYFMALCRLKVSQYAPVGTKVGEHLQLERQALRSAIANDPYVSMDQLSSSPMSGVPELKFILEFPISE
jgi:hypothetical protein